MGNFFGLKNTNDINTGNTNSKPIKAVMAGIDAAGKSTLVYKLKAQVEYSRLGPRGPSMEIAKYKNFELVVWDSDSSARYGPLKKYASSEAVGLIYVVDVTERERIDEAIIELKNELSFIEDNGRSDVPLLIFANKIDLPNGLTKAEIIDKFGLRSMINRPWHVQPCSALQGTGLNEGFEWFMEQIARRSFQVTAACDLDDRTL